MTREGAKLILVLNAVRPLMEACAARLREVAEQMDAEGKREFSVTLKLDDLDALADAVEGCV